MQQELLQRVPRRQAHAAINRLNRQSRAGCVTTSTWMWPRALKTLVKMRSFYGDLGIDIFKDAVSIPSVSLQYLMRPQGLRDAEGCGGRSPSIIFTRYHKAGVTGLRSHENPAAKPCRRVLGFDVNALYLSTMLAEMSCGKERVMRCNDPEGFAPEFVQILWDNLCSVLQRSTSRCLLSYTIRSRSCRPCFTTRP